MNQIPFRKDRTEKNIRFMHPEKWFTFFPACRTEFGTIFKIVLQVKCKLP